ncbi:MAG: RluA family pseudouridine synthase [Anaerolineae bacterium]
MSSDQDLELVVDRGARRLDAYLARVRPETSRTRWQELIREGRVLVDGRRSKSSAAIEAGARVQIRLPAAEPDRLAAESIPLEVVYEDDDLIVVDKPAGMVVHPGPGHQAGTLLNALLARYPDLGAQGSERPGIVHRLDKGTSGLIIFSRHPAARDYLQAQFKRRQVEKVYLSLVDGRLQPRRGIIDAPLGRDPARRTRMSVMPGGRPAQTEYRVLEDLGSHTYLEARPLTGRTHQVRVHLAFAGHPVAGDRIYGRRKRGLDLDRPFLHAHRLAFRRPSDGGRLDAESPLPEDLRSVLEALRSEAGPTIGEARIRGRVS